jgi:hypothetical protein
MKPFKFALAAFAFLALLAPRAAMADSTRTYDFSATLSSKLNGTTSISGSFTVDSVTGKLTTWDITDGSFQYTPSDSSEFLPVVFGTDELFTLDTGSSCGPAGSTCGFLEMTFAFSGNFADLTAFLPGHSSGCFATTVEASAVHTDCVGAFLEGAGGSFNAAVSGFASGSFVTAPEPSSLLMLGAGLLGLVGTRRKLPVGA